MSNKQKLRGNGMIESGSSQHEVARQTEISLNIISQLWRRYTKYNHKEDIQTALG